MLQEEDGSKPDVTITEYIYLFAPETLSTEYCVRIIWV